MTEQLDDIPPEFDRRISKSSPAEEHTVRTVQNTPPYGLTEDQASKADKEAQAINEALSRGDDERLKAANRLAAVRKLFKKASDFRDWCDENISHPWNTIKNLVVIGKKEDPAKALEEERAKAVERARAARALNKQAIRLHGETARPIKDCKAALKAPEVAGDLEKAKEWLKDYKPQPKGFTLAEAFALVRDQILAGDERNVAKEIASGLTKSQIMGLADAIQSFVVETAELEPDNDNLAASEKSA
jgi:hypothetical protein